MSLSLWIWLNNRYPWNDTTFNRSLHQIYLVHTEKGPGEHTLKGRQRHLGTSQSPYVHRRSNNRINVQNYQQFITHILNKHLQSMCTNLLYNYHLAESFSHQYISCNLWGSCKSYYQQNVQKAFPANLINQDLLIKTLRSVGTLYVRAR